MSDNSSNNKRIAKNTLLLYLRMFLVMGVSLYTSRVVLSALGENDFGIYNVIGGVVAMFSTISGSLSAAICRFLTFELGKNDKEKIKRIFSCSVTIQILLCALIIIIAETIGLWFLNNKMNIDGERMIAANWVFQFSVLSFCLNLLNVPFNAAIIAHEKMTAFAYIGVIEVVGKLIVAFLICKSPIDKLIFYSALIVLISCINIGCYMWYCKKNFPECVYKFHYDKELLKQMFGFAGWNFIGASSAVLRDQGGNIILNLFFGTAVNAARGIAMQVNGAVNSFVQNFMTALNPQITKNYANGNFDYMFTLMFKGARLSYYILFILSLPIIVNCRFILDFWLESVPEHTVLFVQLILIFSLSESISNPLITAMLATGKIKKYQIVVGGCQMMNLPLSYLALYWGAIPEAVAVVSIIISQACLTLRLFMLRGLIKLPVKLYLKNVYFNILLVSIVSSFIPIFVKNIIDTDNPVSFVIICVVSILSSVLSIYYIGCDKTEKDLIHTFLNKILIRFT